VIFTHDMITDLCRIAAQAGDHILSIRAGNTLDLQSKQDGSPVTRADHKSQAVILEGLAHLTPSIPVIAEEQSDSDAPHSHNTYWLVDPLDGTRDFITGRNDFSINIGLVINNVPAIGLVYAPAQNDMMFGMHGHVFRLRGGAKTMIDPQDVAARAPQKPRVVISVRDYKKNPTESWLAAGHIGAFSIHASAYKLLLVAAGEADLFVRTGVTSEWDTAAGDAILRAMGGTILTPDGQPLAYKKPKLRNGTFLAFRHDFDKSTLPLFWQLVNHTGQ